MARAETKGFGRARVRRAVNHRAPLAIGKWEASLSWINRRIDDHGNDGFLVPVGDDVGGSGSGRAHHGGSDQHPAKICVHTLSRRVFGVNEPKGSDICSPGGRTSARNPYELWIFVTLPGHRKAILWYYDRNAVSALHVRNERG